MKIAALVLGILGGLIAIGLGGKWLSDFGQLTDMQRAMGGEDLQNLGVASLLLMGTGIAGIVGGIFAFKRKFALAAGLMFAGGIVPLIYASQAIIFLLPLLAGGVVAAIAHFNGARKPAVS